MKHRVITYSESYEFKEYGMSRWRKMGLETEIEEGECPMEVHLKQFEEISAIKAKTIADIEEMRGTHIREVNTIHSVKSNIIEDIMSCKELKVLETYRILVKNKPELQAAYNEMYEKLKNSNQ